MPEAREGSERSARPPASPRPGLSASLAGALLGAFALLATATAAAQTAYGEAPFHEHAVPLAQAAAVERLAAQARSLAAVPQPSAELVKDAENMRTRDLPLFLAGLSAGSPETAETLDAAIDDLLERAGSGEDVSDLAREVMGLADHARTVLLPEELSDRAAIRAALMAELLVSESGVVEAYEEAVEGDTWRYSAGWASLQRVKELWRDLRAEAPQEAAREINELIAHLDGLFPEATPPEQFAADPEEPEPHAHRLVGFLETVVDADLYPGRDIARAAALVHDIAAAGCGSLATGEIKRGNEELAVAETYAEEILQPLVVLAPEAHEAAEKGFARLKVGAEGDKAETECAELLAALEAGRIALGPAGSQ